ncbi:MAG: DUF2793 domain-containing protein [Sphingorhabdus sp.]
MADNTPRFAMPQLAIAQAHKEVTHNEALALIDALLHPVVDGIVSDPPLVTSLDAGKCWLIGVSPTDAFSGHADKLAYWTGGSWRFAAPSDGMRIWHRTNQHLLYWMAGQWLTPAALAPPVGGGCSRSRITCRAVDAVDTIVRYRTVAGALNDNALLWFHRAEFKEFSTIFI